MESDPLSTASSSTRRDCAVAVRSITLSVPDVQQTASFIEQGIGLREAHVPLHTSEHEALWGLAARARRARLRRRRRVGGGRAVPQSPRQAVARGLSHFGSGHPQHRVRRAQQTGPRRGLSPLHRCRRAAQLPAGADAGRGRRLRQRRAGLLLRASVDQTRAGGSAMGLRALAARQAAGAGYAGDRTACAHRGSHRKHLGDVADQSAWFPGSGSIA